MDKRGQVTGSALLKRQPTQADRMNENTNKSDTADPKI